MLTDNLALQYSSETNGKIPHPVRNHDINFIHVHDKDHSPHGRKQCVKLEVTPLFYKYECINIKEARVIQHVCNSLLDCLFTFYSIYTDYNLYVITNLGERSRLK